ncbi:MAG: F0F1 ATP synthase subunit B [Anaerolineae bacterium]|nr:F0F1 ATP synthase subunit B [Anaerolineae bacterium]
MQIEWFTVVAEIINFAILLYLLQRFLYKPIIKTMDQRKQKIAARLREAEEMRSEAERQAERYRQQRQELEDARDEQLAIVYKEVESRRKELLEEALEEIQEKKRDWQEVLRREQETFMQEFRQRVGQGAGEIARRALQDLADVRIEQRMVELFVARLQELKPDARAKISEAIQRSDGKIVVRSAFELPAEAQQMIAEAVQIHILGENNLHPHFEIAPDLISGIEMQVYGQQIAWTIKDYLAGLEREIRETIERKTREQQEDKHGS